MKKARTPQGEGARSPEGAMLAKAQFTVKKPVFRAKPRKLTSEQRAEIQRKIAVKYSKTLAYLAR